MKTLSRIALSASFASIAVLALGTAQAEEYQGVLQVRSAVTRDAVRAEAIAAAHVSNQNADAASSLVAAAPSAPRDRATVRAEAYARAHAPHQNLRAEAFAGSRVPAFYDAVAPTTRSASVDLR